MLEALLQFVLKLLPRKLKNLWDQYEHIWRYCYYGAWTTVVSILTKLIGQGLFTLLGYSVQDEKIPNLINTTVSWIISVGFAYIVNKKYVFDSKATDRNTVLREAGTFYGARLVTYFLEAGIMELPVIFGWNYALMVVLSQFIIFILNYVFSKLLVFRKAKNPPA